VHDDDDAEGEVVALPPLTSTYDEECSGGETRTLNLADGMARHPDQGDHVVAACAALRLTGISREIPDLTGRTRPRRAQTGRPCYSGACRRGDTLRNYTAAAAALERG
jgi:hypothetical protein